MFKNKGIKFQITAITLAINTLIIAILITLSVVFFIGAGKNHLGDLEDSLHHDFDDRIKMLVENVHSLFDVYYEKWQSGELTEEEAKAQAQATVRELRYDNGKNYFWVHQDDGYCIALYGSPKEGTNRFDELDATGTYFIRNLITQGKKPGGGYNDVYFPRMGSQNPDVAEPKRTYSLFHEGLGWEFGTGNYMNDIDEIVATKTDEANAATRQTLTVMIAVALILLIISMGLSYWFSKSIADPIYNLTAVAKDLADGKLNVNSNALDKEKDGLFGVLEREIEKLVEGISYQREMVERLADGDLTVRFQPRSDQDMMGISLKKMVDNLNSLFSEINASANQVFLGSNQVADSAKLLSKGATEQAATIEELSTSIATIAERTKSNAELAEEAVKEANVIRKFINVIDDIALQTNIIALNASVEAARAGQQGNAFAVVAEEVRSLAMKSAQSLEDIESGINESIQLINEIAGASKEQSTNISKINTGTEQVAQVVNQNSAISEQSAAASEEMSAQAKILQELIAQFKLKDETVSYGI